MELTNAEAFSSRRKLSASVWGGVPDEVQKRTGGNCYHTSQ